MSTGSDFFVTGRPDENDPEIPTLTRRVGGTGPTSALQPGPLPGVAASPVPVPLSGPVLQTLLQVEIERTVNRAIDEAMSSVRLRLEQEIPAIVERTLRRVGGHP